MKKRIVLCVLGIIILFTIIVTIIMNKNDNYIYDNGVQLAVKIDGVSSNTFPNGNNYFVDVSCQNARGAWKKVADNNGSNETFKLLIDKITGNVTCNISFTSNPSTLISIVEDEATDETSDDAGYRYEGKNPNNYVWFNNEMWRIIGVVPTKTGNNTSEDLVKIIRNYPIGAFRLFDIWSGNLTSWSQTETHYLLNNYYINSQSASNTAYCYQTDKHYSNCDYSVIGLNNVGSMLKNVYWNTGESNYQASAPDVYSEEVLTQTLQAYVGLMNMSDYGFASNYGRGNLDAYNTNDYRNSNWLYTNTDEWVMADHTNNGATSYSVYIDKQGAIAFKNVAANNVIRPVVYLDPTVYVVSGDGSQETPYQINK